MRRILFPTDFSRRCQAVAPAVAEWARFHKAKVTLLHVIHVPIAAYGHFDTYSAMVDFTSLRKHAEDALAPLYQEVFKEVEVERVVVRGQPDEEIVRYAHAHPVDLIMIPTHGSGKLRALLLGSVAASILHDAECPVWTDAHAALANLVPIAPTSILCAIDLKPKSLELLNAAHLLARDYGAELNFIHVLSPIEGAGEMWPPIEWSEARIAKVKQDFIPLAKEAQVRTDIEVLEGQVGQILHDFAMRHRADLIVMGRGVIHEKFGRLRSHAHDIIRKSPCPVLSI